jgi:glycosyltransferase involved in cell wall biosynthesis
MTTPVLYLVQSLDIGGTQRQLLFLLQGLDRRRFRCIVACDRAGGELWAAVQALGVTLIVLRCGRYRWRDPRGWVLRAWEVFRLVRRRQIRIVHSQWALYALFGTLAGRLAGAPVRLLSMHGHWLRWYDRLILRVIRPWLTAIVEGTPGCIDRLVAQGLPRAAFRLVDYGVDGAPYTDPGLRSRARAALGLPPDAYVVARVARCFPDKGVGDVIEAAPAVLARVPGSLVLVVGDGDELPALRARAQQLGIAGRVVFTGFYADLPVVLAAMDVLTMTSRTDELSLATLEALAAGKPVVAYRNGALIAEAVTHGENGLLLPPRDVKALADALVALGERPAEREAMGRASRRVFEARYGLEAFGRKMGAVYAECLGAR